MLNPSSREMICKENLKLFDLDFKMKTYIHKDIYNRLNYLFSKKVEFLESNSYEDFLKGKNNIKYEFNEALTRIHNKGFEIWYKRLKPKILNTSNVHVYKVIIPGIQPYVRNAPLSNYYQSRMNRARKHYKVSYYYVKEK